VLFSGLIIYNFFAECISRAPALVISRPGFVKKIVFPLEILPWVAMGSALFHATVSFLAWIVFYIALHGIPPLTLFWAPVVLLPLLPIVLGLSWALSALGVYVRDIVHVVSIVTLALLFLSPVFFSLEAVQESVRPLILANPLTLVIEQARQTMLYGAMPDFRALGVYSLLSLAFGWAGFALFQKLRDGFADAM
jgi:lipopolysaccharide transport system permease protein